MKRRDFLKHLGSGAAALAMPAAAPAMAPRRRRRPNILFIMSDDHAAQAIGCYGGILSTVAPTPNIDRIASGGMRFDNCFCTNSICTPSRATILSGKYSHKNGCRILGDKLDGSQPTFPKLLQSAGYYTAVVGKWHLETEPAGFDYYNVLPGQGLYFDPLMKEKGRPWHREGKGAKKYSGYVSDVITDIALQCLENRPQDRPFCLLYHHKAPHDMWEYAPRHAGLFEDIEIPEPSNLFDDYRNRAEAIRQTTQKLTMERAIYLHPADGGQFDGVRNAIGGLEPDERKHRTYQYFIKAYLRCAASIDENVGRVLDWLDANGLAEDTMVVYTSDQGCFLGEHGLFDKRFMYEESLRMPLIVRYPRLIRPGSVNKDIVINTDFAATFADFGGVSPPSDLQGKSLRPLFAGRTPRGWRKSMYYRYWMHGAHFGVPAHFGVRTRRYKLIYYYGLPLHPKLSNHPPTSPEWELFDLKEDPREMNNVYGDPEYEKITKQLKAELRRLRKDLDDGGDGIVF